MADRIINRVVDRLFNRINQEPEVPEGSSTPVSLPNVIQQIVSNPALPQVEGELRNRFNTRNPSTRSTPSVPPRLHCLSCARNIFRAHFLHISCFSTKNARILVAKILKSVHLSFTERSFKNMLILKIPKKQIQNSRKF